MKRLAAILAAMSLITALFGCTKVPEYPDLDSFFAFLGKTCSEAGIDETTVEYFQNAPSYAPVKGKLFGVRVSGVVFFSAPTSASDSTAPTDAYVISRVSLETKSLTFDECKAKLTELFGDPVSSDMTPYIPSKGAVTELRYESEKGSVTVSHASEQKTVKLEMIP